MHLPFGRMFAIVCLLALLPGSTGAQEQEAAIAGRVTDAATQQPIADAQVMVVGTTRGTRTTDDGRYRIPGVTPGQVQVRVVRIGFESETRPVTVTPGETAPVDFALNATAITLDRVVVTATGEEQRVRERGNSVATLDVDEIDLAPITNFSELVSGRAAGVVVQQFSGTTGTSSRIRIRGSNSVSLSNAPLLIIDGVKLNNSEGSSSLGVGGQVPSRFDDINPEDIESIEILKGPAASALYGTAAANGVIQIRTKRGRTGPARWTVFAEGGSLREVTDYPPNFAQVGTLTSNNRRTAACTLTRQATNVCVPNPDSLVTFNPLEQASPFTTGFRRQYGVSVSGGGEAATYYASGEFEDEEGVYSWNTLDRVNLRVNVRAIVSDDADIDISTGYLSSDLRLPQNDNNFFGTLGGGLLGSAFDNPDGRGYILGFTPQEISVIDVRQEVERFTASASPNWRARDWLSFTGTAGIDFLNRWDHQLIPPNRLFAFGLEEGSRNSDPTQIFTYTANANATATFSPIPSLTSTTSLGVQLLDEIFRGTRAFGAKLLAGTGSLSGTSARFAVSEVNTENVTVGGYVSQQLAWNDRLFLTGAVRGDDNSAFGEDFGLVYYPSAGASWVISEEPFFPRLNWLTSLRIRSAYGQSGQRPNFRDAITFFDAVSVTQQGAENPAITPGGTGNIKLKPEKSAELEVGFEVGLFEDRVGLDFTYYDRVTRDALIARRLAPDIGSTLTRFENLGKVSNRGVEALLRATVLNTESAQWDIRLTLATSDNELLDLGEKVAPIIFGRQQFREGFPLGGFFDRAILSFDDADGNRIITADEVTLADTNVYLGTPFPTREIAFTTNVTLFNTVRVSAVLDHRGGQKQINLSERFRCAFIFNCRALYDPTASLESQAAAVTALLGSDAGYIEDSDFTKLRELAVTLIAPGRWAQQVGAREVSLTLAGRNLATWTDYSGLDPEVNFAGGANFTTTEFFTQPPVRYYTARLNINF
ncbi:MAG: SusC/RagA family TonB-linked outer membrane protein [Gemmatimonadaceae bacterium]